MIPAIHFLLTFWLEKSLFIFENNFEFAIEVARAEVVSDKAESIIVYVLSKLCAALIIVLFWKMIFGMAKKKISPSTSILFGVIFMVGLVIGIFYYPSNFSLAIDNYVNYAMAIRFIPTYWQFIFTGAVYAGSMMVVPHPIGIFVFQWMAFVGVVGYIYTKVEVWLKGSSIKYATLAFFLLPETYYIIFDAYRNNYYTMLCMFYFAYLFFTARREEKKNSLVEMLVIAVVSAFLMVWRSEGILIGAIGLLYLFFFAYKLNWKRVLAIVATLVCSFMILSSLQDIGAKKYYGEDYMIVNTTEVLRGIFNNPNAVASEEDIAAIEAIVPIQVLKERGLDGYRNYNWTMGRLDFNQSLADDETASAYMAAYYRIILNNMTDFLNVQANNFFAAMQINAMHIVYSYMGGTYTELEPFVYYRWEIGQAELYDIYLTEQWMESDFRNFFNSVFTWCMQVWREFWVNTGLSGQMHALALMADIVILCVELINLFTKRTGKSLGFAMIFLVLIGEFAAVVLFMPVGRSAYLYPMLYSSYMLIFLYVMDKIMDKKNMPKELETANEK